MKTLITCTVNGEEHTVLADSRDTLLDLLRERIGLTGAKEGCGNGNCGTCTVIVDGAAVNACLVLAQEAPGRDILTIEGLSRHGKLHPIQQALVEHGGTQCGFCTPGIVLAAKVLLDEATKSDQAGHSPRDRRQHLPLHGLRQDRRGHCRGRTHKHEADRAMNSNRQSGALKVVGKRLARVDARERVNGSAIYPADIRPPGYGAWEDPAQSVRPCSHPADRCVARPALKACSPS